jgi:gamma-glutamylcyclotransferase (GGCT)/AIG2-like uncharacterized protein YtfP
MSSYATAAAKARLRLFVYGTLMRGHRNHGRYCGAAIGVEPAAVWGRLYHLRAGYPAMEIPDPSILAQGTEDPLADAAVQLRVAADPADFSRPMGDWDLIQGEIITFDTPLRELPPIDRLEGFRAGHPSLYQRALVVAQARAERVPAWLYWMERPRQGIRLSTGRWGSA